MPVDLSQIEIEKFCTLYDIEYLSESWYYTDADHSITYNGHTYTPAAIKHGEFNKDSELTKISLDVTFPIGDLAQKFISFAPPAPTYVTLTLYQESTIPQALIAFRGEVTKFSLGEHNACVATLDEQTIMTTKLPKILIQPACNHILFDSGCKLVANSWKVSAVISALSFQIGDPIIHSPTFALFPVNYFTQGVLEFEGDKRHITYHGNDDISLQVGFPTLDVGDTVYVWPGCNKEASTCKLKFNNLANFLGCPYVPRKNPVLAGL
jgi:uncharacterized phage protein (TIGR02218 family)